MAQAVAHLCKNTPITKVVAITKSGFAARALSLLQISQPIIAVSDNVENARTFNLFPGTKGVFVDIAFSKKNTDHIILCLKRLWKINILNVNYIVVVIGLSYPKSGNRFNHIQLHSINDSLIYLVENNLYKKFKNCLTLIKFYSFNRGAEVGLHNICLKLIKKGIYLSL